jgi:hypothetical protein
MTTETPTPLAIDEYLWGPAAMLRPQELEFDLDGTKLRRGPFLWELPKLLDTEWNETQPISVTDVNGALVVEINLEPGSHETNVPGSWAGVTPGWLTCEGQNLELIEDVNGIAGRDAYRCEWRGEQWFAMVLHDCTVMNGRRAFPWLNPKGPKIISGLEAVQYWPNLDGKYPRHPRERYIFVVSNDLRDLIPRPFFAASPEVNTSLRRSMTARVDSSLNLWKHTKEAIEAAIEMGLNQISIAAHRKNLKGSNPWALPWFPHAPEGDEEAAKALLPLLEQYDIALGTYAAPGIRTPGTNPAVRSALYKDGSEVPTIWGPKNAPKILLECEDAEREWVSWVQRLASEYGHRATYRDIDPGMPPWQGNARGTHGLTTARPGSSSGAVSDCLWWKRWAMEQAHQALGRGKIWGEGQWGNLDFIETLLHPAYVPETWTTAPGGGGQEAISGGPGAGKGNMISVQVRGDEWNRGMRQVPTALPRAPWNLELELESEILCPGAKSLNDLNPMTDAMWRRLATQSLNKSTIPSAYFHEQGVFFSQTRAQFLLDAYGLHKFMEVLLEAVSLEREKNPDNPNPVQHVEMYDGRHEFCVGEAPTLEAVGTAWVTRSKPLPSSPKVWHRIGMTVSHGPDGFVGTARVGNTTAYALSGRVWLPGMPSEDFELFHVDRVATCYYGRGKTPSGSVLNALFKINSTRGELVVIDHARRVRMVELPDGTIDQVILKGVEI